MLSYLGAVIPSTPGFFRGEMLVGSVVQGYVRYGGLVDSYGFRDGSVSSRLALRFCAVCCSFGIFRRQCIFVLVVIR